MGKWSTYQNRGRTSGSYAAAPPPQCSLAYVGIGLVWSWPAPDPTFWDIEGSAAEAGPFETADTIAGTAREYSPAEGYAYFRVRGSDGLGGFYPTSNVVQSF